MIIMELILCHYHYNHGANIVIIMIIMELLSCSQYFQIELDATLWDCASVEDWSQDHSSENTNQHHYRHHQHDRI